MSKADREPNVTEERHNKDSQWLTVQLQDVVDLASARGMDEYVASFTFLMFAHELNRRLAPNSLVGTAVSLKVITQLLFEENQALEKKKTGNPVDESDRERHLPEGETLH